MSTSYFIGDTHWGHKNILKYRPDFPSIEKHDTTILENILSVSNKKAHLWLMGDCFFQEYALDYLAEIKKAFAAVHFVIGNHDTDTKDRQVILRNAIYMCDKVHALTKYHRFWLTHAPIHPCELRGLLNIHGHMHTQTVPDHRYLNVSCEQVDYTPISIDEIRKRFGALGTDPLPGDIGRGNWSR